MTWLLWLSPDIFGLLFVVGWPAFYRNVVDGLLEGATKRVSVDYKGAKAVAEYHADLNLATASAILFLFSLLRWFSSLRVECTQFPDWTTGVGPLYVISVVVWLLFLHVKSDRYIVEYFQIENNAVSPFVFWPKADQLRKLDPPGIGKIRVAGPHARRVFWTRWLLACGSLALGIASGVQAISSGGSLFC